MVTNYFVFEWQVPLVLPAQQEPPFFAFFFFFLSSFFVISVLVVFDAAKAVVVKEPTNNIRDRATNTFFMISDFNLL